MRVFSAKAVLTISVFCLLCVSLARADSVSFDLTSNNLGISGSIGTVAISDTGGKSGHSDNHDESWFLAQTSGRRRSF
jgi:hypothetical protein